jgi:hypothetical protein
MKTIILILEFAFFTFSLSYSQIDTLSEMKLIDSMFYTVKHQKCLLESKRVPYNPYSKSVSDTATYYFKNGQLVLFELITFREGNDGMGLPSYSYQWALVNDGVLRFYCLADTSMSMASRMEDTEKYIREHREYYGSNKREIANMSKRAEGTWETADSIFNHTPWHYGRISTTRWGGGRWNLTIKEVHRNFGKIS